MLNLSKKFLTFCVAFFTAIYGKNINKLYPSVILFFILVLFNLIADLLVQIKNNATKRDMKKSFLNTLYKKIGYFLIILIAFCMNYAICNVFPILGIIVSNNGTLVIAVITWINLGQMLEILNNTKKFGIPIPGFLKKLLTSWQNIINKNNK